MHCFSKDYSITAESAYGVLFLTDPTIFVLKKNKIIPYRFLETFGVPGVLGILDGTLIRIIRPNENEESFYCYKGFHALNVQMVRYYKTKIKMIFEVFMLQQSCTADCIVTSIHIVPGSNNDQFCWNNSTLKEHMHHLRSNADVLKKEGKFYIMGNFIRYIFIS